MKVIFYANVSRYTNGESTAELEPCEDIYQLVEKLINRFGKDFEDFILDSKGEIGDNVFFLVNGRHISNSGGLATKLSDGDEVSLLPVVEAG